MSIEVLQQECYEDLLAGGFIEIKKNVQKDCFNGVLHKQIRLGKYLWAKEYKFLNNLFQNYPFLDEHMKLSRMKLSYNRINGMYQIELYQFVRNGGYKEPWVKEVISMSLGFSFEDCLRKIEQQLIFENKTKDTLVLSKVLHE